MAYDKKQDEKRVDLLKFFIDEKEESFIAEVCKFGAIVLLSIPPFGRYAVRGYNKAPGSFSCRMALGFITLLFSFLLLVLNLFV